MNGASIQKRFQEIINISDFTIRNRNIIWTVTDKEAYGEVRITDRPGVPPIHIVKAEPTNDKNTNLLWVLSHIDAVVDDSEDKYLIDLNSFLNHITLVGVSNAFRNINVYTDGTDDENIILTVRKGYYDSSVVKNIISIFGNPVTLLSNENIYCRHCRRFNDLYGSIGVCITIDVVEEEVYSAMSAKQLAVSHVLRKLSYEERNELCMYIRSSGMLITDSMIKDIIYYYVSMYESTINTLAGINVLGGLDNLHESMISFTGINTIISNLFNREYSDEEKSLLQEYVKKIILLFVSI